MSLRTVPRASFVAALVLGLASALFAAPTADDEAHRLDDHLYFVQSLGRGWEPLLTDIDRSLASLAGSPPDKLRSVQITADAARETVAKMNQRKGEAGASRALELFDLLARTAVDESKRPGYHKSCADILMIRADAAQRFGDDAHDAQAFDLAMKALGHVPGLSTAFDMIARLGLKVGLVFKKNEEYEKAIDKLNETIGTLRTAGGKETDQALVDVKAVITDIKQTTGPLAILWLGDPAVVLAVKGPKTDYTHAALAFSASGKSPPPAQSADAPRLMRTGTWSVTATGVGAGAPVEASVEITPQGGSLTLLTAMPDGMVVVPSLNGADAFLIDRTEVSNVEFQAMTSRPRAGNPRAAVAGITFNDALAAANAAGKRLPSLAQWTHAAFGAPNAKSPRYPWGNDEGQPGVQFVGGVDEAQDVESCAAGRSVTGCLNMAGNVWEWLDNGWLIGGGWKLTTFSRTVQPPNDSPLQPWAADFLRDPLPTEDTYNQFTNKADEARYLNYMAKAGNTLPQAGFRCVVPLGKPQPRR